MDVNRSYDSLLEPQADLAAGGQGKQLAQRISEIFSPPLVAVATMLTVAVALADPLAWLWAGAYLLVAVLVPVLFVLWLVNQGTVSDFDLRLREQRIVPYLIILAYLGVALTLLIQGGAPAVMIALGLASLVEMALLFLITLFWKISAHAAAVAGWVVLLVALAGGIALPLVIAIPLVMWARLRLRRHTLLQTLAGALSGAVVFGVALYLAA